MANTAAVLNIMVAANTAPASAQLTALQGQLAKTTAQANTTSATVGGGLSKSGKMAAVGLGGAAVAAIAVGKALSSSVKAASSFESSFAEVRKTVDTNEAGFKNIERGLRNLSKRIPISIHELNNLAGEAGALGIASKDIVQFTEVAAKLGTTTNLSSSEAANALARLSNIMGTSAGNFKNLASTLVGLGNAGASTEAEIAEMALRIAGTGKQVGLSEAQVLGFASALASVGINAEAGGSAISRAFSLMSESVATGNDKLAKFAEVAGMTAPAFTKLFEQDAAKAMLAFTEGLSKSENAIATLADLDLNDVRLRDALLRAAGASELFREQLGLANKEFRDGKALDEEAQKRYDTFAAKVEKLKNRFYDLKITVGNELLPTLSTLATELDVALAQLDGTTKKTTGLGTAFKVAREILFGFGKVVQLVARVFRDKVSGLIQFWSGFLGSIREGVKMIGKLFRGNFPAALEKSREAARQNFKAIIGIAKGVVSPIARAFQAVAETVREKFRRAYIAAVNFVNGIIKVINKIPGVDIGTISLGSGEGSSQRGRAAGLQRGGALMGGKPSGDSIPAMLERGEYVLNREAVKKIGVQRLNQLNFKNAPRFQRGGRVGMITGGDVVDAAKASVGLSKKALDLVAQGPGAFMDLLPNANLPEPISGLGPWLIKQVSGFIKDKVGNLLASASGGVPGYTGPPPDFKQLGNNSWVDSNTLAVGYYLANKFGVSITDGWRPQNASYGAINSSHKRGTPGNPGALDFAPPSTALQSFAGKHIAGLTENDIHDWGTGLHNHIAFFQRGGMVNGIRRMATGGEVVRQAAPILNRRGFDHKAAAGILGNAWGESSWNPGATGYGGGGLFGFTTSPVSLADMQAYAASKGKAWTDVPTQIKFMLGHGQPTGMAMKGPLNALDSIPATTEKFMVDWERPGIPRLDERIKGGFMASDIMRDMNLRDAEEEKKIEAIKAGVAKALARIKSLRGRGAKGYLNAAVDNAQKANKLAGDGKVKQAKARLQKARAQIRTAIRKGKKPGQGSSRPAQEILASPSIAAQQRVIETISERITDFERAAGAEWSPAEGEYDQAEIGGLRALYVQLRDAYLVQKDLIEKDIERVQALINARAKKIADLRAKIANWQNDIEALQYSISGGVTADQAKKWRERIDELQKKIKGPGSKAQKDEWRDEVKRLENRLAGPPEEDKKKWQKQINDIRGYIKKAGGTIGTHSSFIGDAQTLISDTLRPDLDALVGFTGESGLIGDTNWEILNLDKMVPGSPNSPADGDSEIADLLRQQLQETQRALAISQAQMPIFQQFMPRFHQGGIVQGPMGAERPVMAQAGEGVFTRDQMRAMGSQNITVVIEDAAIDSNRIRVEVDGVIQDKVSTVRRQGSNRKFVTSR